MIKHVKRTTQIVNLIEGNKLELRSCHCSYAYILIKETIKAVCKGTNAPKIVADINNKEIAFKKCARFTKCSSEINNADVDNAKNLDVEIPMYNITEYSNNYSKSS